MTSVFTAAWQRHIRREISQDTRRSVLVRKVGEDGTRRLEAFKAGSTAATIVPTSWPTYAGTREAGGSHPRTRVPARHRKFM
jgi:hypothetical protein